MQPTNFNTIFNGAGVATPYAGEATQLVGFCIRTDQCNPLYNQPGAYTVDVRGMDIVMDKKPTGTVSGGSAMDHEGVSAGSYDPAIPNKTDINTGIHARNIRSDMCMCMKGKDNGRKMSKVL